MDKKLENRIRIIKSDIEKLTEISIQYENLEDRELNNKFYDKFMDTIYTQRKAYREELEKLQAQLNK